MDIKRLHFLLLTVLLCVALLVSCSSSGTGQNSPGNTTVQTDDTNGTDPGSTDWESTVTIGTVQYDADDEYSSWEDQNPNYIELNGSTARLSGSGATIDGGKITISAAGVYVFSGKLDNGQILVDVQNKGTVRLVLNGATIYCNDSAPVFIKNAGKAILSLPEGTVNAVSDGTDYVFPDASADEPGAAIYSKADLTINGSGQLTVQANYNDGITGKDDLKITGGRIIIQAADDGLVGRDSIAVQSGEITIEAGGDGIKSTNDTDASKGFIVLEGGSFNITAGADGIQAETALQINDGRYTVTSGGSSQNSSDKSGEGDNLWGRWQDTSQQQTDTESGSSSAKGMKAETSLAIGGGTFSIDSSDDAIHSNGLITIAGGDFSILSGDDGIHADSSIGISGGKLLITKSYEGIESAVITVTGGELNITASDDGINIAGGNDGSSINGRPGQNSFSSSGSNTLDIHNGSIYVNSGGDGIDVNGSVTMEGGTVLVDGPTNNGNGALDYDGTFEITGGLMIAAGSSGMAMAPSEQSSQYTAAMTFSGMQQAGTLIHLEDNKGNTIATFAPAKQYSSVVISSPDLAQAESYRLYTGGSSSGNAANGLYTGGSYQGGNKILDFTLSNTVTWLNESGVTQGNGGFGGGGFGGGGGNRPGGSPGGRR